MHSSQFFCVPNGTWVPFTGAKPYTFAELEEHEQQKRPQCNASQSWKYTWKTSHARVTYLTDDELCDLVPEDEKVLLVSDSFTDQLALSWRVRVRKARGSDSTCLSKVDFELVSVPAMHPPLPPRL